MSLLSYLFVVKHFFSLRPCHFLEFKRKVTMASVPYPSHLNIELTPELERDVAFFKKWGYLVVEDAISLAQVETLRQTLDDVFARKEEQFINQLLEQDDAFDFLLDTPPVFRRMQAILGSCVQLHSATARVALPGEKDQNWHRDVPWPVDPEGTAYGAIAGQINCGYYLDELTEENGPIAIVPGSQRVPFRPPASSAPFPEELRVLAQPGQAIIFDGCLYHRGVANNSTAARRACLMCYQPAWMKSREPFDGPFALRMRAEGSDEQKMLMGAIEKW
ncbi:MAG: ectoine hydroxylase-related dioxygenase (phytanoyl-CoA dioxygenase family) [Planctomycetota bacterium]|jgi:ectoine hydroxylase-related dioxygenase (phytanoyl-CoA dioxygenase family)